MVRPMLLDTQLHDGLAGAAEAARTAERVGFAGVWAGEVVADPALALAAATSSTDRVLLGTNVILAFTRNPMSVAMQAWDLQRASHGRFTLGLATQVKAHITRRFSMPWEAPVARLREFVQALRHIFGAFQGDHPMDFPGRFYHHTLLHPKFNPGPIEHPRIPIGLGGVGPQLTTLAGELGRSVPAAPVHEHRLPEQGHAARARTRDSGLGSPACGHLGVRLPDADRR